MEPRRGWLTKEPVHKGLLWTGRAHTRYFVLSASEIEWHESDEAASRPKGSVPLHGARVERVEGKLSITAVDGRTLTLSGEDLDGWERSLRRAIADAPQVCVQVSAHKGAARRFMPTPSRPAMSTVRVHVDAHKAVPLLMALDDRLVDAFRSGAIKLIVADRIRDGTIGAVIARRQELEARERDEGMRIFCSADEAIVLLRANGREVGALTYGWASPDHPDVSGAYLAAVRRFLCSPLGAHVQALFWDFPSLPQKPRDAREDKLFALALMVMADVYASLLGTTVMRHRAVPARPASLDGEVVVLAEAADEAAVRCALEVRGALVSVRRDAQGRWRARFASHADAERAVAAGPFEGATALFPCHNARPYDGRGWPRLESGVSTEGPSRAAYFPGLSAALERLPPKVVEIDGAAPEAAAERYGGREGAGPRIERVRASIQEAFFTGKGDKEVVVRLYNDYITIVNNAFVASGEGVAGIYEGGRNDDGEADGRGSYLYLARNRPHTSNTQGYCLNPPFHTHTAPCHR